MPTLQNFNFEDDIFQKNLNIPAIEIGDKVKVVLYLELLNENEVDKGKERLQTFEGIVISKHLNAKKVDATITVRKMVQIGGIEKVFLLNSPWIKSINILSRSLVRKSKLYYLRKLTGKSARLKRRLDF